MLRYWSLILPILCVYLLSQIQFNFLSLVYSNICNNLIQFNLIHAAEICMKAGETDVKNFSESSINFFFWLNKNEWLRKKSKRIDKIKKKTMRILLEKNIRKVFFISTVSVQKLLFELSSTCQLPVTFSLSFQISDSHAPQPVIIKYPTKISICWKGMIIEFSRSVPFSVTSPLLLVCSSTLSCLPLPSMLNFLVKCWICCTYFWKTGVNL